MKVACSASARKAPGKDIDVNTLAPLHLPPPEDPASPCRPVSRPARKKGPTDAQPHAAPVYPAVSHLDPTVHPGTPTPPRPDSTRPVCYNVTQESRAPADGSPTARAVDIDVLWGNYADVEFAKGQDRQAAALPVLSRLFGFLKAASENDISVAPVLFCIATMLENVPTLANAIPDPASLLATLARFTGTAVVVRVQNAAFTCLNALLARVPSVVPAFYDSACWQHVLQELLFTGVPVIISRCLFCIKEVLEHPDMQERVKIPPLLERLVRLFSETEADLLMRLCYICRVLAHQTRENRVLMHQLGFIPKLCAKMGTRHGPEIRREAAAALGSMVYRYPQVRLRMSRYSAIKRFTNGLCSSSLDVQVACASALRNIAVEPRARPRIFRQGAVRAAILLLWSQQVDVVTYASAFLWNMSLYEEARKYIAEKTNALDRIKLLATAEFPKVKYHAIGVLVAHGLRKSDALKGIM